MKKKTLKGTREANTMMALVCATAVHLIGPQAHADIVLDGTATINGSSGSEFNNYVAVGDNSPGTLNVTSGGVLNVGQLNVGWFEEGLLNVTGGTVNAGDADTFLGFSGRGTINVTNSGTLNTYNINVGIFGDGLLNVNGGSVNVTTTAFFISYQAKASATVTNGTLTIGGDLILGDDIGTSPNALDINSGGLVRVSGNLTRRSTDSVINLNAGGTLQIGTGGITGTLLGGTGNLENNGTLIFNHSEASSYSGVLSGSGALEKQGTGTLTLSGANTYTGATTVSAGTLEFSNTASLYNATTSAWTAANLTVASGATAAFNVGGAGEFTSGNLDTLVALGNATNGFQSGSSIGLDTTNGNFSYDSVIANPNSGTNVLGLTKLGSNTLTLTGSNTYTGGTTLTAGTLALGSSNAIGSSGTISFGGGTLQASASNTIDYSARFSNAASQQYKIDTNGQNLTLATALTSSGGSFTKLGSGTLTLSGANTYTSGTTLSGGTLTAGNLNAFGTGALTIGAGTFLDLANYSIANTVTNNGGTILNAGTLAGGTFNGGTTDLSGANSTVAAVTGTATVNVTGTDTAITTVSGGTVNVNAAGTTIQSYNGGDVAVGAGLAVTVNEGTSSGSISGAGGLTKAGSGTLALSGSNSFSGALTVSGGILNLRNATGLGTTAGSTTVSNGATLQLQGGITVGAEALSLNGGAASDQTGALVNVSGTNTYGGAVTVTASSSISAASGSVLNLTGGVVKNGTVATFNGGTFIRNSGTLNANVTDALPTANGRTAVIFDGTGTSVLSLGAAQSVASLTSAGAATLTLGANTLTVGTSTGSTTFAGVISGSGGLIKDGASTQILTGANTYTGTTTISAGTLEVSGASGALTATSAVNINGGTLLLSGSAANRFSNTPFISLGAAGSTLQLSGSVTETLGALTLAGGAGARVIDFGATSGLLTFASLSADSHLPLQIWNWSGTIGTGGGTDRFIISSGNFGGSLAASNISFFSDSGTTLYSGATTFSGTELVPGELVPVPEASTLLGVLGLMAPLAWRERRHWMRCREARG
jgi:autotransporter-associated beta strand protein